MGETQEILPRGFNETIAYYCLNPYKNFDYSTYVDKHKVKGFVKKLICVAEEYAYFTTPEEIENFDYSSLPESFIIKATHGCGWNIIVKNGFDKEASVLLMKQWLTEKYRIEEEKQYAQVLPGILIEEYLDNKNEVNYKWHVINGKLEFLQLLVGSSEGVRLETMYDKNWKVLPFTGIHGQLDFEFEKPSNLKKMIKVVRKLAKKINKPPYVRIDVYIIDGNIYFGEYTFTPTGGGAALFPEEYEKKYGALIKI